MATVIHAVPRPECVQICCDTLTPTDVHEVYLGQRVEWFTDSDNAFTITFLESKTPFVGHVFHVPPHGKVSPGTVTEATLARCREHPESTRYAYDVSTGGQTVVDPELDIRPRSA